MSELQERLRKSEVRVEPAPGPDLEELLEDMRLQYEKMAARNKADSEQWYQEKVGNQIERFHISEAFYRMFVEGIV